MSENDKKGGLEKPSILGGKVDDTSNDYSSGAIAETLKEKGLSTEETFTVRNPVSGKTGVVTIARDGTTDSKTAIALADPKASKEFKEMMVANWLFERGKESASFIAELYRYKGAHTQETRKFKAQVRQDMDSVGRILVMLFKDIATSFYKDLGIEIREVDDKNELSGKKKVINIPQTVDVQALAIGVARACIRLEQASNIISRTLQENTFERERAMGKYVFVDGIGRPYMVGPDGEVFYQEEKKKEE